MYEEYEYFSEIDDESQLDENDPEVMIENNEYSANFPLSVMTRDCTVFMTFCQDRRKRSTNNKNVIVEH